MCVGRVFGSQKPSILRFPNLLGPLGRTSSLGSGFRVFRAENLGLRGALGGSGDLVTVYFWDL